MASFNPFQFVKAPALDADQASSQLALQQRQQLVDMLKQQVMNPAPVQNYGAIASRTSPITPIVQALMARKAAVEQQGLNEQYSNLFNKQYEGMSQMFGGQQSPQQTTQPQTQSIPPEQQPTATAQPQSPPPQASVTSEDSLRNPKWVTSMNPGGFNPQFAQRQYMTLGPEKYSSQFIEPFVKPVEAQHTREGLIFDPKKRAYSDADGNRLTAEQVQAAIHPENSKPLDELSKLNEDYKAGRMSKQDYEARKTLMTTRAPSMYSDQGNPDQQDQVAQMIANYQIAPPSPQRMQTPQGLALMSKVNAINPDYHAEEFGSRTSAYKAFATGKQGDAVKAFNVGISHLGTAQEVADALDNGDVRLFNRISQKFAEETGNPAPTNFDTVKQIVKGEVVKATVGGQAAEKDRDQALAGLDKASSPAQLKDAIKYAQKLMGGQLGGLKRQYEQSTGRKDFERLLSADAKPFLSTKEGTGDSRTLAPQAALDHLKAHPELADQFKAKYGYLP